MSQYDERLISRYFISTGGNWGNLRKNGWLDIIKNVQASHFFNVFV